MRVNRHEAEPAVSHLTILPDAGNGLAWCGNPTDNAPRGASVTETGQAPVTWLTQDAYDRLKNEYEFLSGPGRAEIVKKIEAAREEGDLRENGGYHAAKEEQG